MKKYCIISAILLILQIFCGCRRVMVTPMDEFTMQNWYAETKSGISAELNFSGEKASFSVKDEQGKLLTVIEGSFAIDMEKMYITDDKLYKSYAFGYKVYGDKAELEYAGETLDFYPVSEAETSRCQEEKTE